MAGFSFEQRDRSKRHQKRSIWSHQLHRRCKFEGAGRRLRTAEIKRNSTESGHGKIIIQ